MNHKRFFDSGPNAIRKAMKIIIVLIPLQPSNTANTFLLLYFKRVVGLLTLSSASVGHPHTVSTTADWSVTHRVTGSGDGSYAVTYRPYKKLPTTYIPTNFTRNNIVGLNSLIEKLLIVIS